MTHAKRADGTRSPLFPRPPSQCSPRGIGEGRTSTSISRSPLPPRKPLASQAPTFSPSRHLHFKHITHRRIGTNNRFADQQSSCRFCRKYVESSVHFLGRCPGLKKIFGTINKTLGFTLRADRNIQEKH
eukprot:scaffold810_cov146-Isochrysis_galbana.AAC.2